MKERKKRGRRELDTASAFAPPPGMVAIAAQRTRAITRRWGANIIYSPADFMVLVESCYIQGVNDAADAAFRAGWIPGGKKPAAHLGDLP